MSESRKGPPKNVLPDLIIPAIALLFTAYYLTTITEVPWIAQASAITVATLLLVSIVAYALRTALRVRQGHERIALDFGHIDRRVTWKRVCLLGLTVGYVLLIEHAGFTITTLLFIFLAVITVSSLARWRSALVVALVCSTLGYVVFIHFFKTRFPRGPVEELLRGLL